jgi:hypothetical protein
MALVDMLLFAQVFLKVSAESLTKAGPRKDFDIIPYL